MTPDETATFKAKTDALLTAQQAADTAVAANSAAQSALSSAQSTASSAASTLSSAQAAVLAGEQDLVTFVDGLIAEAGGTVPAPTVDPAPAPAPELPAAGGLTAEERALQGK